jgi:RNA polymerase sigma factor (sigma-70 family)
MVAVIDRETDTRTDEDLAVAVASREEGAIDVLVSRYWRRAYLVALQLVGGDPGAAEDVAQETFVQILRSAERFKPDARFRPWFFQILRHVASKRGRSDGRRRRREEVASVSPVSAPHTEAVDTADAVRSYLGRLAPPIREALALHYLEGLTHREVATVIGAPLGTVSSRIRTGVERLRSELQGVVALGAAPLALLLPEALGAAPVPGAPVGLELTALAADGAAMAEIPEPPAGETLVQEVARAQKSATVKALVGIALICGIAGYFASRPFKGTGAEVPPAQWRVAAADLELKIPSGWVIAQAGDTEVLARTVTIPTGFADNVNVMTLAAKGKTLAAIEAENRAEISPLAAQVHSIARQVYPWGEGLGFDYERIYPGKPRLRHAGVIILRGDRQIVVTVTCQADRWRAVRADLKRLLDGIVLDDVLSVETEPR